MATNLTPPLFEQPPTRAKRLCGICKTSGHDRRNCPRRNPTLNTEVVLIADGNQNGVNTMVVPPPVDQPTPQIFPKMNWGECMYVILDLETTGGSRLDDDIIEIAAMVVGPDSIMIEDGTFHAFVKPKKAVSTFITCLTGITNDMVATAPPFSTVAVNFFDFVQSNVDAIRTTTERQISCVILVAHNGHAFDIPFFLRALDRTNLRRLWEDNNMFGYSLDTLQISRAVNTLPVLHW